MSYKFAPAVVSEGLSKYYDVFVEAAFVGKRLHKKTLSFLDLENAKSLADVGCGTGTLAVMAKQDHPDLMVTGIDPGESVISVATDKAQKEGVDVTFTRTGAEELPLKDASVDRVCSSLAFHHLPTDIKRQALSEVNRALADDGVFMLVDIGKPKNLLWKVLLGLEALVEPREYIKDNLEGKIPELIEEAGFTVEEVRKPYMGIRFWRCRKI